MDIAFNKPFLVGKELQYIKEAHEAGKLAGDGFFTKVCHQWLENQTGCQKALLTHSCTAALEMSAILAKVMPGDEIIMPSYTFVSTANAFVLRGGVPVFVDIRPDTLNLDETRLEDAITNKTKAIVPVHYAGVGCEMETILEIAASKNLLVIEDAAQGVMASYKGHSLGSIGNIGAFSFHETKNIISGEGGALLINDEQFVDRAEVVREKGTDRSQFFRGQIDKYTWQDIGSSYLPGEIIAAFLYAQMEEAVRITEMRIDLWNEYNDGFLDLENAGKIRRPFVPDYCQHNAHMYYLLVNDQECRDSLIQFLADNGIHSTFHYVPLHSSPAGRKYCKVSDSLSVTEDSSVRLLRLPLWPEFKQTQKVIDVVCRFFDAF